MQRGIISKIFDWIQHPANSEGTISDWFGFLLLALIASFLWSTVVRQTLEVV